MLHKYRTIFELKARLHDKRFGHGTLNFCRVNGYKTGPRAQQISEVVSARQREGTRI